MKTGVAKRGKKQGEQIGRIFAHWMIVFFGQFFLQKKPKY
jgi:hypothetical protein